MTADGGGGCCGYAPLPIGADGCAGIAIVPMREPGPAAGTEPGSGVAGDAFDLLMICVPAGA